MAGVIRLKQLCSRFITLIIGATFLMSNLSACGGSSSTAAPAVKTGSVVNSSTTTTPSKQPVAAMVNDQPILLAALDSAVNQRLDGIRSVGDPIPADMNALRLSVLDSLITQVLIEQAAAIQNITVTDADVETEVQADINIAGGQAKWQTQLDANHLTTEEYRIGLRSALVTQKMRDIVTKSSCVAVEQIHARHILVADETLAKQIESKIAGGADFAQLAGQFSLDITTKQTGGDLGWFARGQLLQKSVEDSAFNLPINQVSNPVKSDLGYHIIQTLERVKDRPVDPDTCSKLAQRDFERWIQELTTKARIEKYPNGRS